MLLNTFINSNKSNKIHPSIKISSNKPPFPYWISTLKWYGRNKQNILTSAKIGKSSWFLFLFLKFLCLFVKTYFSFENNFGCSFFYLSKNPISILRPFTNVLRPSLIIPYLLHQKVKLLWIWPLYNQIRAY